MSAHARPAGVPTEEVIRQWPYNGPEDRGSAHGDHESGDPTPPYPARAERQPDRLLAVSNIGTRSGYLLAPPSESLGGPAWSQVFDGWLATGQVSPRVVRFESG